jgi:xanthine dehydrogenase YagS FAD-binding subunit
MNAQVKLTSKRGKRTVAMGHFYVPPEKSLINETVVQPGEIITAVFVPVPEPGTRSAYQKYGEKESFDWPLADAGVVLVMEGNLCRKASIVLGVAAPRPSAPQQPNPSSPLSQNGFKTQFFQTAIYRTVLLAAWQMPRDPNSIG